MRESGVWADDSHLTTHFWAVNEERLCQLTAEELAPKENNYAAKIYREWEAKGWEAVAQEIEQRRGEHFDVSYVADLLGLMAELSTDSQLMIGNSLPVRHVDQFGRAFSGKRLIRPFGNRGASGIDGVVSTACGIASAEPALPTILVIGDVSFFHDLNGLLLARQFPNLTIVLFNNGGGHIFQRLPISRFDPSFTKLFLTPQEFDFSHAAAFHHLHFTRVNSREAFAEAFQTAAADEQVHLIEIVTDGARDEQMRKELVAKAKNYLAGK